MTHPVFAIPHLQCAKCLQVMSFEPGFFDLATPYASAWCRKCGVTVKIPLTRMDCELYSSL